METFRVTSHIYGKTSCCRTLSGSHQPPLSPTKAAHRCSSVSCRQMRVRTVFLQNPVRVTETELRHCDAGLFVSNDLTKKMYVSSSPSPSREKTCQPACCTPVARSCAIWWLRRVADEPSKPFLMRRLLVNLLFYYLCYSIISSFSSSLSSGSCSSRKHFKKTTTKKT